MSQDRALDEAAFAGAAKALIEQDKPVEKTCLESLGHVLIAEFKQAENERRSTEIRWLKDLRQYRGQYDPEVIALIPPGKSRSFVRKTRVKVKTIDSRVGDLLFPAGRDKNWTFRPTPKPSLSTDQKIEIREMLKAMAGGKKITRKMFDAAVMEWSKTRCAAMSLTVDDQLKETAYRSICTKAIHSGHLYGTGIIKGPLIERKVRTRYVRQDDKWVAQSESYVVPFIDYVPLWRFYPDMGATELKHCRYTYERHLMSKAEMADLGARKSFNKAKLVDYVMTRPHGEVTPRTVDSELRQIGEREAITNVTGKYEVLERWGWLDGAQLRDAGAEVPDDRLHESFFSNVWLLPNGEVIKAVLQPINGVTWPYHIYYFDKDESSIFAEGVATIMRDDQEMINAGTRMTIDNAAMTSGAQLEITPSLLSNPQDVLRISPWQAWLRNRESPGARAVHAIELPSRVGELSALTQTFENNADETTAIPRYMSGENATNGAAGTSSGLSMLMGNVTIVIKDLLGSWDDGVTCSFVKAMYFWNMQFNPDDKIKGDFDVAASGTASLVAKEVRAAALDRFGVSLGPADEQYIKRDELLRQRAESNELTDVVKTPEEIKDESESDAAKKMQQMQMELQEAQLGEAKAKVSKLVAEAEVAQTKVKEVIANIDVLVAKAIQTRVDAAYAALQAGGTATSSPFIAPAGDEILRSAGWVDRTPNPSMADLNRAPVQATGGSMTTMGRGQTFAEEPRGDTDPTNVDSPDPMSGLPDTTPRVPAQTGQVGARAGIETQRIEP